jgi:ketol-acid reductoisomerase
MTTNGASTRVFGEADGDLSVLAGTNITFVGYGNQGRSQALNLRDTLRSENVEARVHIGVLRDYSSNQAKEDGFQPVSIAEAVQKASVVFLLIPDEVQAEVFARDVAPNMANGSTLVVASGYNLMFGGIVPSPEVDVVLLAPRMIGRPMRELYESGNGFYSYVGVEQDATGRAWQTVLALARGIGSLRLAAFEISARDETVIDLLMEQGFGSMLGRLIFETLAAGKEAGLPPEALVLELYLSGEMSETFQAMAELGFVEQSRLHSPTSQYGGMMRSISLDRAPIQKHLTEVIEDIVSGSFARRWAAEQASGYKNMKQVQDLAATANPFTPIEQQLRAAIENARQHKE